MQSHKFNHPEQWKTEQHVKYRQVDTERQNNIILKGKLYCKKLSNADKEKRYYAVMQATIFIGFKNTKVRWASRNTSQFSVQHNKSCLKKGLFSRLVGVAISLNFCLSPYRWPFTGNVKSHSLMSQRISGKRLRERTTNQQTSFPAKSSCTCIANSVVSFPGVHNEGKLIIFPTDLRKSHHSEDSKYTLSSKDHMQK